MLKQEVISEIFKLIWLAHNKNDMNVLRILHLAFQADRIMWGFFLSCTLFLILGHCDTCVYLYIPSSFQAQGNAGQGN